MQITLDYLVHWLPRQSANCVFITLQYDEMGMVDAVARFNPVSLAYEVTSDFMHYDGGVYTRWEWVSAILLNLE